MSIMRNRPTRGYGQFLLLMSCLHLAVRPLYCCSPSLLWTVFCDITSVLFGGWSWCYRLLLLFIYFFTALTFCLLSPWITSLILLTQCISVLFFLSIFQAVVLAIPNYLFIFKKNTSYRFSPFAQIQKGMIFSHRQLFGLHVGLPFFF